MKLQITFDLTNLEKSLTIAPTLVKLVDSVEVGSLLLYKHGEKALLSFKETLQDKSIGADGKIVDNAKETATLLINAGADWITVMAGTKKSVIHSACSTAGNMGKKAMINLMDASSTGQAALEAKSLGGDAIVFPLEITTEEGKGQLEETWEIVRGNTTLPIYVKTAITEENLEKIVPLNPYGLIISLTESSIDNASELINTVRSQFPD